MKKYIYTVFAVAAVLSSCSKSLEFNEDINSGAKAITSIGASTEISTRAVVSSDGTKVNWQDGDQLGVLGANGSSEAKNLAYTLNSASGSTSGTFTNGSSNITTISAVMYPHQASASWDDTNSKLTCEIPSVQAAVKGSFDKAAAVMYSTGNTTDVQLKFAVNFLKVTVSETNVHAISISSTTTALSGRMEITSEGGVSAATSGSQRYVTLTAGKGNVLAAGDYYIAVKAGDIENPTISYVYLDQTNHSATEKSKAGSGKLSFAEGKNVKPISVDFDNGTVTTRDAVQLWADGPYFAEYNVGVTDGKAESYGGYYTWGDNTATNLWGSNWRMPTMAELEALLNSTNCGVAWTDNYNGTGIKGRIYTGKGAYASNSVFLPAAGYCYNGTVYSQSISGFYWSSTPLGSNRAYYLFIYSGSQNVDDSNRYYGYSVRAVLKED